MLSKNAWKLTVGFFSTLWIVYITVQLLVVQKTVLQILIQNFKKKKVTFTFECLTPVS